MANNLVPIRASEYRKLKEKAEKLDTVRDLVHKYNIDVAYANRLPAKSQLRHDLIREILRVVS